MQKRKCIHEGEEQTYQIDKAQKSVIIDKTKKSIICSLKINTQIQK
jgi:hypothetical protein